MAGVWLPAVADLLGTRYCRLIRAVLALLWAGSLARRSEAKVTGFNQTILAQYNPTYTSALAAFKCVEESCAATPECGLGDPIYLPVCASLVDPTSNLTTRIRWDLNYGELYAYPAVGAGAVLGSNSINILTINMGFLQEQYNPDVIASDIMFIGLEGNCTQEWLYNHENATNHAIFFSRQYWYDHSTPGVGVIGTEIHPTWFDPAVLNQEEGTFTWRKRWFDYERPLNVVYMVADVDACDLGVVATSSAFFYTEHVVQAWQYSTTSTTTTTAGMADAQSGPLWEERGDGDVFPDDVFQEDQQIKNYEGVVSLYRLAGGLVTTLVLIR